MTACCWYSPSWSGSHPDTASVGSRAVMRSRVLSHLWHRRIVLRASVMALLTSSGVRLWPAGIVGSVAGAIAALWQARAVIVRGDVESRL